MAESTDKRTLRLIKVGKTRYLQLPLFAAITLLLALVVMTLLFWSVKRRVDTHMRVEDPGELRTLIPSIVGLTQGSLEEGNQVEVLQNGGFFPPLLRDISAARHSVHVETYIWWDSQLARQLAALLARKAREGVKVRLLVDGSGGRQLREEDEKAIEAAGGMVGRFHPFRLADIGRINNRDHRKIMVIDGKIGFIGGHGIADEWTGNAQDKKHWRDTGLRLQGPVVNRLQGAFAENWIEATGEIPAGDEYFPRLPAAGPTSAHVAYTSPSGSVSSVQILYYLALKAARREIIIQNPYLLPERDAVDAMAEAVRRGVKVWIMVPSTGSTDNAIVQHASHHRYGALMKAGVRIWEYEKTLLHQKLMIVDGIWSCVGSTNFDDRSFEINDEISIGVIDARVAGELRAAFFDDLRFARERRFEEWSRRSIWHRLQDGLAYLGHEQL